MKSANKALWQLWEKQGYQKRKLVNVIDLKSGETDKIGVLEIDFDTH